MSGLKKCKKMWLTALWWSKWRKWHHVTTAHDLQQVLGDGAMPLWALPLSTVMSSTDFINKAAKEIKHKLDLIWKTDLWSCFKTVKRLKRQRDFLEVSLGRRGEQWETEHETPSNSPLLVFFCSPSLLFILPHPSLRGCYPTPSCSLPSFFTAASHRHLLFVSRGLTQWTILSVFPKISWWERDRVVSQRDWSSEVHSPPRPTSGYKSLEWEHNLLGPRYTASLPACLTDLSD